MMILNEHCKSVIMDYEKEKKSIGLLLVSTSLYEIKFIYRI